MSIRSTLVLACLVVASAGPAAARAASLPATDSNLAWLEYHEGAAVPAGYVLADVSGRGLTFVALQSLQRRAEYMVKLSCFGPAEDGAERLVSEQSMALIGGFEGVFRDTRTRAGYNPEKVGHFENGYGMLLQPQREPALYARQILITSDDLRPVIDDPQPGQVTLPHNRREQRLLEHSDVVRCGRLTFHVYQPGATRFEAETQRREVWYELVYDASLIPSLTQKSSDYAPHAWVKCSLSAPDLGFLFDDGTPLPTQEEDLALQARVAARAAQLSTAKQ